jgi:hypothetical protein
MPLDISDLAVCPPCHELLRPFPLEPDGVASCFGLATPFPAQGRQLALSGSFVGSGPL